MVTHHIHSETGNECTELKRDYQEALMPSLINKTAFTNNTTKTFAPAGNPSHISLINM